MWGDLSKSSKAAVSWLICGCFGRSWREVPVLACGPAEEPPAAAARDCARRCESLAADHVLQSVEGRVEAGGDAGGSGSTWVNGRRLQARRPSSDGQGNRGLYGC